MGYRTNELSDLWVRLTAVGLMGCCTKWLLNLWVVGLCCQTIGLLDLWAVGLMGSQTNELSD